MSFVGALLERQRLVQPENVRFLAATFGMAGGLWMAWRLARRAVPTLYPAFLPGEPNPALLATPFENITSRYEEDDGLTNVENYDVIIIGGGTAGCVLASRLSEDPNLRVLLIEAGKSDLATLHSRIPGSHPQLVASAVDHNLKTIPQTNMHNREISWPRGKILGGCSSINALVYHRCAAADYDEWAEKYGARGWAWKDLEPYFKKAENLTPSSIWPIDMKGHGRDGPWQISYPSYTSPIVLPFISGCNNIGIPTVPDINHGQTGMSGVTRLQTFIDSNGRRSSTATAYLTEDVCRRRNLKISVGMTVSRIITETAADGKPVARGVELASGPHAPVRYRAKATRDIIVACGAVHTPHLLKLSGIGPQSELTRHNIKVVKDLPGVGANLQDQLLIPLTVNYTKSTGVGHTWMPMDPLRSFIRWLLHGSGILSANLVQVAAWLRSYDDPEMVDKVENLASSPYEPDMEIFTIASPASATNLHADYWIIAQVPLRPSSIGSITLADNNSFTPPLIHANYLNTERDRLLSIWAFKKSCDIAQNSGAFVSWLVPSRADELSDDEILEYMKDSAGSCYHPCGTAKIGVENDGGVVDTNLSVYGVPHLRVCDASVMPRIPSGHICAPVIAIAEKLADMLKSEYGTNDKRN